MDVLRFVLVGVFASWLSGRFMRGYGFGVLGNNVAGILGAIAGGYLFRSVGEEIGGGILGSLMVAFAGAIVVLFAVRFFTGRRAGRRIWS